MSAYFKSHDPEEDVNTILHSSRLRKEEVNGLIGSILTSDVGVLVQSINSTWMTSCSSARVSIGAGGAVKLDYLQFHHCIRLYMTWIATDQTSDVLWLQSKSVRYLMSFHSSELCLHLGSFPVNNGPGSELSFARLWKQDTLVEAWRGRRRELWRKLS